MPIAVSGSIATDHLMHFPGRFQTSCWPTSSIASRCPSWSTTWSSSAAGSPATSLSGWACSGCPAAGRRGGRRLRRLPELADPPRRRLLQGARLRRRADRPVRLHHRRRHEPDRVVLRRRDGPGPGDRARAPVAERGLDLVVIGADDPEAMVRHTEECRERGSRSPPTRRSSWPGWTARRSAAWSTAPACCSPTTTSGPAAAEDRLDRGEVAQRSASGSPPSARRASRSSAATAPPSVGAVPEKPTIDPTGVGDAFRAGFLAGRRRAVAGALGAARLADGHPRPGDRRHPGVTLDRAMRPGPARRRLRRGRRRRDRAVVPA